MSEFSEATVPNLAGRTILVVDDIKTNRIILRTFLLETAATIEEAADGDEALTLFAAAPVGHYDFIFMDLLMPNMHGHAATRAIRNLERADATTVPIVAVTACAFQDDIEESLAAGMDAHLAKPIDFAVIMRVLSEKLV
jgi:CheY-like chemotaxis protein